MSRWQGMQREKPEGLAIKSFSYICGWKKHMVFYFPLQSFPPKNGYIIWSTKQANRQKGLHITQCRLAAWSIGRLATEAAGGWPVFLLRMPDTNGGGFRLFWLLWSKWGQRQKEPSLRYPRWSHRDVCFRLWVFPLVCYVKQPAECASVLTFSSLYAKSPCVNKLS